MAHVKNIQKETNVLLPAAGETYVAEDGTVSQVLEDVIDADYEPTEDEVREYAEWMGMQLPEDVELLWIAREGLKTPLPKEWKPCKTDEGEVYYFNFRTGESSWHHPMDNVIRKKYEREKERLKQKQQQQQHQPKTANKTAPVGFDGSNTNTSKTAMASPRTAASSPPSSPGIMSGDSGGGVGVGALGAPSPFGRQQQPPTRIVSEAERKLEDQICREVKAAFEAEKAKAELAYEARVAALRKLHGKDIAEIKGADAARRAAGSSSADEERSERIRAAREKCDAKYGSQLRELERQAEDAQTQIQKVVAEKARMASQSTGERAAAEREAATALQSQLKKVEAEVAESQRKKVNVLTSSYNTRKAALEKNIVEAAESAQVELMKDFRQKEVSAVMAVEARRRRLEEEKKSLELDLRNADMAARLPSKAGSPLTSAGAGAGASGGGIRATLGESATSSTSVASPQEEVEKRIRAINAKRDATCLEVRTRALREQAAFRTEKAAAAAELQKKTKEAATAAAATRTAAAASSSSATSSAAAGAGKTFAARMAALRAQYTKEKLDTMNQLTKEREARMAEAKSSTMSTPLTSRSVAGSEHSFGGSSPNGKEESELTEADAATVEARAAYYKAAEDAWTTATAENLAAVEAQRVDADGAVAAAVAADLQAFTQKISARRARERAALEERRDKMLTDHAAATKAYAEKKAAAEACKQQEVQDTKDIMLADAMEAAVAKEKAALDATAASVRTRRLANHKREEEATKAEIEEELQAYLQAELQRVAKEEAAQSAVAAAPQPMAAAPTPATAPLDTNALTAAQADKARLSTQLQSLRKHQQQQQQQRATALARVEAQLKDRQAEQQQAQQQQQAQRQRHATELAAKQSVLEKAKASAAANSARADTTALTTAPATAAAAVVTTTRLVPPPDSVAKATHAARMAALEESYRSQESSLRGQLMQQLAKAQKAAQQQPQQQRTPTLTAPPISSHSASASTPVAPFSPASNPATISTNDALRLWHSQREELRRRQEAIHQHQQQHARVPAAAGAGHSGLLWASSPLPQHSHPQLPQQSMLSPFPSRDGPLTATATPEPQLIAVVETLHRTIGALSSRVAQLESQEALEHRQQQLQHRRVRSASATAGPRLHPSGLPSSPPRLEKIGRSGATGGGGHRGRSADAVLRSAAGTDRRTGGSLKQKWDRSLVDYGTERAGRA